MSSNGITFKYSFKFGSGDEKKFNVTLDPKTLNMVREVKDEYPAWTELDAFRCPNCPLDSSKNKYCPVITSLLDVIVFFKDSISYEEVDVVIETEEREYVKHTAIQSGLNPLMGIFMVATGCPVLGKLKPMVRFHLPFASLEETNFRMISMYLFAQYFIYKEGMEPDWDLKGLIKIYEDIRIVNKNFCERLSALKVKDAAINALVTLDCFAFSVSYSIDKDKLLGIKDLFSEYLSPPES
jgi:hypothetical protein